MWWVMLAGAAALFALVMILFTLVIRRPGWGSGVSPSRWIVLGGLVLPAIVLIPLVAYGLIVGEQLLPLTRKPPLRIEAEGRQWVWTFRYPEHGGAANRESSASARRRSGRYPRQQPRRHPLLLDPTLRRQARRTAGARERAAHSGQ